MLFSSLVHSWNGHKARLDRDVDNQRRQDRKRSFDNDENDLDRGRVKKVKMQNDYQARNDSKFNQYQEQQNQWRYNNQYNNRHNNNHMYRPRHGGNHNRPHNNRYNHHNNPRHNWRR